MVRGKEIENGMVSFSFTVCDGMSHHYNVVDKDWFNEHNTPEITNEELEKLAWNDKEHSKATGKVSWWGLG